MRVRYREAGRDIIGLGVSASNAAPTDIAQA